MAHDSRWTTGKTKKEKKETPKVVPTEKYSVIDDSSASPEEVRNKKSESIETVLDFAHELNKTQGFKSFLSLGLTEENNSISSLIGTSTDVISMVSDFMEDTAEKSLEFFGSAPKVGEEELLGYAHDAARFTAWGIMNLYTLVMKHGRREEVSEEQFYQVFNDLYLKSFGFVNSQMSRLISDLDDVDKD